MRLAAKTASWSITHMLVAIAVAYALTGNWQAALAVGLIEPVFQTIAFLLHERAWSRVPTGRGRERTSVPAGSRTA